jgi:lysophospholipase L1-like esterase
MKRRDFLKAFGIGLSVLAGSFWRSRSVGGEDTDKFSFCDLFTTDQAAGTVNGTAAEPGPGTRRVTDTSNQLTIASGLLIVSGTGVSDGNPQINISGDITRQAGICGITKFRHYEDGSGCQVTPRIGFHGTLFSNSHVVYTPRYTSVGIINPAYLEFGIGSFSPAKLTWVGTQVWCEAMIRLRANGAAYYINDGNRFRLCHIQTTGNNSPLWFGLKSQNADVQHADIDSMGVFKNTWIQPARVSDSFDRSDGPVGVSDGLGCEEPGGAGTAWEDALGILMVATNKAQFSTLTGGKGMALVDVPDGNVNILVNLYRSAGVAGVVFKYKDANNYCVIYHDGINIKLDRVVSGAVENTITSVVTYVDGAPLSISVTEIGVTALYNNVNSGYIIDSKFTGNSSLPINGTKCGLFTTDTGNTFDNFAVFDTYPTVPFTWMTFPGWSCFGDSLTDLKGANGIAVALAKHGKEYAVRDYGIGGQTTTQGLLRFTSNVLTKPDPIVSIQMGVNDLWGLGTPAGANQVKSNLQTMYTAAKKAGKTVVAISLYPCKGAESYKEHVQTNLDLVNAWLLDTKHGPTDVDYCVDGYSILEDPGNPDALLAAYDNGSHLHLTTAGYAAVGEAVYTTVFPPLPWNWRNCGKWAMPT